MYAAARRSSKGLRRERNQSNAFVITFSPHTDRQTLARKEHRGTVPPLYGAALVAFHVWVASVHAALMNRVGMKRFASYHLSLSLFPIQYDSLQIDCHYKFLISCCCVVSFMLPFFTQNINKDRTFYGSYL